MFSKFFVIVSDSLRRFLTKAALFFSVLFILPIFPLHAEIQRGLSQEELLNTIQERAFQYFIDQADPHTGLMSDHANNFRQDVSKRMASVAATGFGLTAYPIGIQRNWIDHSMAKAKTLQILHFFLHGAENEHGFFYHYLNPQNGTRSARSELSPIDTALFIAGMLFAAEYFEDPEIRDLTRQIYERVDWPWMLNGGKTFALAWTPEAGFDQRRWDHFDESLLLYLLALGSPTHPISAESWSAIQRPVGSYRDYKMILMPPLFTHQFPHIWIDFKNQNDGYADYFKNSTTATLVNRTFCMDQAPRYASYGANSWGLSASNGPFGYRAYGAPPGWAQHDGTVAATACGASIVFTPQESVDCMRYLYENLGDRLWGRYGFSDAFNLDKNWFDENVIGIDQGALLAMIENARTRLIWNTMKKNLALQQGIKSAGFKEGSMELTWPEAPSYQAPYRPGSIEIDGYLRDWSGKAILLSGQNKESGEIQDDQDLSAETRFAWDEEALYFSAKVTDDSVILRKSGKNIWQDDMVEIFVDPEDDGLFWNHEADYQIGFRNDLQSDQTHTWSWFQGGEDPSARAQVMAAGFTDSKGYIIEGAVRWSFLNFKPYEGAALRLSIAVHDIDRDRSQGKLQWFFRPEKEYLRFGLGKLILAEREKKSQ